MTACADPRGRHAGRRVAHPPTRSYPECLAMTDENAVSRRGFLETAGLATGAAVATGALAHPAVAKVKGANDRINFAILGPGGRAQSHIKVLLDMKEEAKPVDIIAVADVYERNRERAKARTKAK